jgi:AGZA family xanthine/uracil permease-like MFS transporter
MRYITKGDWDGFFGLGLNNFINLLLIISLCQSVLGFSEELIVYRILPGMALGVLFGNFFYSWQARALTRKTGKHFCAIPYGINLLPIFFYTFYVMVPAQQIALARGLDKLEADKIAWMAGVLACLGSGLIELGGSYFAPQIKKVTPRAALLSAIAAVGLFFIAADYTFRTYAFPVVGLPTFFLTLYLLYGSVKMRWNLPAGLIVLTVGIAISWITHWLGFQSPVANLTESTVSLGWYLPLPFGLEAIFEIKQMIAFAAVIIPMGLINLLGSLQCMESASAAGDDFPIKSSLAVNGIGTMIAGLFGSPYPTTIYIGHPGWKLLGAGSSYSLMNGVALALLCITGTLGFLSEYVPIEAGMAILIWIGFTISSQAFQVVPKSHAPAIIAGLIPGMGAFIALVVKRVLGATGYGSEDKPYSNELLETLTREGSLFAKGIFALEQGWLYASVVLATITVAIVEKKFTSVIAWLAVAGGLAFLGIIHHFQVLNTDITTKLGPAWNWIVGYLLTLVVLVVVRFCLVLGHEEREIPNDTTTD